MTVDNRVLRTLARWIMRVEAAGNVLRILLFGGTFLSTGLTALQQYGLSGYALPFIVVTGVATLTFAYVYAEFDIYNQKSRDMADAGDNYSGPTMYMDAAISASQLAMLAHALQNGDKEFEELKEEMEEITAEEWKRFRSGIDEEQLKAN